MNFHLTNTHINIVPVSFTELREIEYELDSKIHRCFGVNNRRVQRLVLPGVHELAGALLPHLPNDLHRILDMTSRRDCSRSAYAVRNSFPTPTAITSWVSIFHVLMFDVDAVWLRNPFPAIEMSGRNMLQPVMHPCTLHYKVLGATSFTSITAAFFHAVYL